tara:strand:+ start:688 stop:810 length:123 start_codon:yes stop_codon:yes gene_type:complete
METDEPLFDWQGILELAGLMKQTKNRYKDIDQVVNSWHRG